MSEKAQKEGYRRKARLKTSFQVAIIVLIIFLLSSAAILLTFHKSVNELTEQSKEKVIDSIARISLSTNEFRSNLLRDAQARDGVFITSPQFFENLRKSVQSETETEGQKSTSKLLASDFSGGSINIRVMCYAIPSESGCPVIVISNDDQYLFKEIPPELESMVDQDADGYEFIDNGIPEMGLEGSYLVTYSKYQGEEPHDYLWQINFISMGEVIDGMNSFYAKENRRVYTILGLVGGLSALGLILVSFIVMGYLVNKRISRPIAELSDAAVEVMEGDLDVQVPIKPHEEFSELKSAFNSLVSSLSRILTKSLSTDAEGKPEPEIGDKQTGKSEQIIKPRSTILFQVISLFIVVFLIAGALSLFFVNSALNSLVKNSKDELIRTQADYVSLIHKHGVDLSSAASSIGTRDPAEYNKLIQDFVAALSTRTESELTRESNDMFARIVDWGLMDIEVIYVVLSPTPVFGNDYMVIVGSNGEYLYSEPPPGGR
ncbi:MAG: HAMP domain-containing protein [Actinobacteria bacterium]|nr:HAMP domain-containing protein [Actinomycetota bacterium]